MSTYDERHEDAVDLLIRINRNLERAGHFLSLVQTDAGELAEYVATQGGLDTSPGLASRGWGLVDAMSDLMNLTQDAFTTLAKAN